MEKLLKRLIALSLIGLFLGQFMPDARALTVSATVSSTMVSCTTPLTTTAFGTINNSSIYNATSSTTTLSSSGSIYLKAYGVGSGAGDNPGLWSAANSKLIASATSTASTTLTAGTEGYGIVATTTSSNLQVALRYRYATASANAVVGGVATSSGSQFTVASSSVAITSQILTISYETAVAVTTAGGTDYQDTITFSCSAS